MDAGVWVTLLGIVVGVGGAVIGFVLRGMQKAIDEAKASAQRARDDLHAYQLAASERFASIAYLKDVETRILTAIEKLETSFQGFVKEYHSSRPGE